LKRKIVLGIGNILNSDEGVGVHAVLRMQQDAGEDLAVEFLDGGTLGLDLLPIVEDASHLLLLDAIDAGLRPGSVIELDGEEIPKFSGIKLSLHQTTFQDVLSLAQLRGGLPERLYLIGVQPVSLELGTELSPEVANVVPDILKRAWAVVRTW